jgi:PiT family inorganic phosphate transporter
MIVLVLAAGSGQLQNAWTVPQWVMVGCAAALATGVAVGGMRIVKSVGHDMYRMEPVHSFASQLTATSVVMAASILGGPASTTQVVAASVMGVGAARRLSGVRWGTARNIAYAWLLTVPVCAGIGAASFWCLKWISAF